VVGAVDILRVRDGRSAESASEMTAGRCGADVTSELHPRPRRRPDGLVEDETGLTTDIRVAIDAVSLHLKRDVCGPFDT